MHEEFDFSQLVRAQARDRSGPFTVTPYAVNHPVEEAYALRVEVTEPAKDGTPVTRVLSYSGDTDSCAGWRTRRETPTSSCARRPSRRAATTASRTCT